MNQPEFYSSDRNEISSSDRSDTSSSGRSEISPSVQSDTSPSGRSEINSSVQNDIGPSGRSEINLSVQSDTSPSGRSVINLSVQSDTSPSGRSEISPSVQSDIGSSGHSEINSFIQSDIGSSSRSEINSFVQSDIDPSGRSEMYSSDRSNTDSSDGSETNTADQSETIRLALYRDLANVSDENAHLVQHVESGKTYVKKTLRDYDRSVFEYLKMRSIPGVPRIVDIIEDFAEKGHPDTLIVIEEYVSGSTLREVLDAYGSLKPDIALDYMIQICRILEPLHGRKRPIVHCRITPENVIVTRTGNIYLINFDNAKEIEPDTSGQDGIQGAAQGQEQTLFSSLHSELFENDSSDRDRIQPSFSFVEKGKSEKYIADDSENTVYIVSGQFENLPAIPQTDILECGSLFREMLSGVSPASPTPKIPMVDRPEIEILDPIITKCTETEVAARYADAPELLEALIAVVPEINYLLMKKTPHKKKNRFITILTGILFLAAIMILVLFLTGRWPPFPVE